MLKVVIWSLFLEICIKVKNFLRLSHHHKLLHRNEKWILFDPKSTQKRRKKMRRKNDTYTFNRIISKCIDYWGRKKRGYIICRIYWSLAWPQVDISYVFFLVFDIKVCNILLTFLFLKVYLKATKSMCLNKNQLST